MLIKNGWKKIWSIAYNNKESEIKSCKSIIKNGWNRLKFEVALAIIDSGWLRFKIKQFKNRSSWRNRWWKDYSLKNNTDIV